MSESPRITVLMPAYNTASYIHEAIKSILAQTFIDFEFLIIDDGSTDETPSIIKNFNDPRIRVISRSNKGLIASLNEGIVAARAPLIARHDADDICLPDRLQRQYNFLSAHPEYLALGSDVAYIDRSGVYISRQDAPDGHTHEEMWQHRFHKCPFLHPTVLFRKEAIAALGGYPADALSFEDWLLWVKLMEKGRVCNLPEVLVHMRINPESVTIDEKWRPKEFHDIRLRSLKSGRVSPEDAVRLEAIIRAQNFSAYKQASYYAFVAKKYLWDNQQPALARKHLRQAIKHYPKSKEPYMLYALSYLPKAWVRSLYNLIKKDKSGVSL